ncbi:capsular polysaccharide synthesis protein [Mesorhizobium sp. ANAO-SY3R2]|uniref:capsular polysaccharide synthesis protein n=1 Tax=Mesorhizobium sp. ANAO-SY3R2 TaxID=3166644 RepID=UPI003671D9B8
MTHRDGECAIERNIWILWLQGFELAPELVKICANTWSAKNPGWHVHLLTEQNLADFLDNDFHREIVALALPPQKTANLVRLYLVSRYGGVWADADCYCARALDDWLPSSLEGGFFAFRFDADAWLEANRDRPLARLLGSSADRVLSNWFIAGRAGNPISSVFLRHHLELFQQGNFGERRRNKMFLRFALFVFRRNAYVSSQLANLRLLQLAGTFPYFVFHYHFARLLLQDSTFHAAWRNVVQRDNRPCLAYSKNLHLKDDERFREDFEGRGEAPLLKLHWKQRKEVTLPGSRYRALVDGSLSA